MIIDCAQIAKNTLEEKTMMKRQSTRWRYLVDFFVACDLVEVLSEEAERLEAVFRKFVEKLFELQHPAL